MAPETSPRPRPRPETGFELQDALADLDPATWLEAGMSWLAPFGVGPVWLVAAVAGALCLLVAVWVRRAVRRRRRACRWKKGKHQKGGTLTRWGCRACGAEAYSHDGKPPKECKRGLRVVPL